MLADVVVLVMMVGEGNYPITMMSDMVLWIVVVV